MHILILLLWILSVDSFECIFDGDCRSGIINNDDKKYCSDNRCVNLLPPMAPCKMPHECAPFSYYGPLACSAKCGEKNECGRLYTEKTTYCCKSIPASKKCNPSRPKHLNGCSKNQVCLTEGGQDRCFEKTDHSWVLGGLLSICGNLMINLGVNFQKKSYSLRNLFLYGYTVSTMFIGILLYILGKISSFSAYIFCNQSLLAGLSATGLISNSIFAPIINNEIFTWNDMVALIFVSVGSYISVSNTGKTHNIYSVCELMKMLKQGSTVLCIIIILITIALLYLIIKFVEINSSWGLSNDRFSFLAQRNINFPPNGIILKYVMIIVYVFLSSFIASFTTLSIKILGEIFNCYFNADGKILNFSTAFFITTLVICTFGQIYWLNRALKHYDALLVVPIFHMTWTILSILTAGIYFQDFETYSNLQLRNFIIGILIEFSGSFFLGLKIKKNTITGRRTE